MDIYYSQMEDRNSTLERLEYLSKSIIKGDRLNLSSVNLSKVVLKRRSKAIEWINMIIELSQNPLAIGDIAIQIFDDFLLVYAIEGNKIIETAKFMSLAAVTSVIIASKVYDSNKNLTTASFPMFDPNDIINFERHLLRKINYEINTLLNPRSFMIMMTTLLPNHMEKREILQIEAGKLITAFSESSESISFYPFTIALSALLLTCSKFGLDFYSSAILSALPRCCFWNSKMIESPDDVDRCILSLSGRRNFSPTCVTEIEEAPWNDSLFAPISELYSDHITEDFDFNTSQDIKRIRRESI